MDAAKLRLEIKKFTDSTGLVHPKKKGVSGNGLLYSAEYFVLLSNMKALTASDIIQWKNALFSCRRLPGLYNRHKTKTDQNSVDDYVGIAAANSVTRQKHLSLEILNYGKNQGFPKYVYNNVSPGVFTASSWLGRQGQLIAHIELSAGITPPIWRTAWWVSSLIYSGMTSKKENHDAWILSYLVAKVGISAGGIFELTAKLWFKRFEKVWPGGLGAVLSDYFKNPDHPLAKYWRE